jgi:hypothetical protein
MTTKRSLADIPTAERDALRIVEALSSAIAWATMFSPEALRLAADHIKGPAFLGEDKAVLRAFIELLERGWREGLAKETLASPAYRKGG